MYPPKSIAMKAPGGQVVQVPTPGFGTFTQRDTTDHAETIARAIKAGFRHLDCAWEYGVSDLVGHGFKLSGVSREDLFIVSKFSPQFAAPGNVEVSLDHELRALGTDYLDLFLAHVPVAFKTVGDIKTARMSAEATFEERCIAVTPAGEFIPDLTHSTRRIASLNNGVGSFIPTWNEMKRIVRSGKVRAIGVSNFEIPDLQEIIDNNQNQSGGADHIPISCNQIETHPWFPNTELVEYMRHHDILVISYSPLSSICETYIDGVYGSSPCKPDGISLIDEPVVKQIADKNGMGRAQVLHSWLAHRGDVSLGRTYTDERMKENLDLRVLSAEDCEALARLKKKGTTGKSFIMSLCFPPIDFGDMPRTGTMRDW